MSLRTGRSNGCLAMGYFLILNDSKTTVHLNLCFGYSCGSNHGSNREEVTTTVISDDVALGSGSGVYCRFINSWSVTIRNRANRAASQTVKTSDTTCIIYLMILCINSGSFTFSATFTAINTLAGVDYRLEP